MTRRALIAVVRFALLSLGLGSTACGSGSDPSRGGAVVGVQVDPSNSGGGGGYIQGIALGSNALYAAFFGNLSRVHFDGSGSSAGLFNENTSVLELAVAAKDGSVWWAGGNGTGMACAMGGPVMGLWTSSDAAFLTIDSAATPTAVGVFHEQRQHAVGRPNASTGSSPTTRGSSWRSRRAPCRHQARRTCPTSRVGRVSSSRPVRAVARASCASTVKTCRLRCRPSRASRRSRRR